MIILHNPHDKQSRDFVERFGANQYVIDFYGDNLQAWIDAGGTLQVQGFPAIILDLPEIVTEYIDRDGITQERVEPAGQSAMCLLQDMVDFGSRAKEINDRIRASKNKPPFVNVNKHAVTLPDRLKKDSASIQAENRKVTRVS